MNNPFRLLGIRQSATKAEILAKTAAQMRQRPADIKEIAEAQKTLFDPKQRAVAEFLCIIEPPSDIAAAESLAPPPNVGPLNLHWLETFK